MDADEHDDRNCGPGAKARLLARLRALMAHTVSNGCTEDEELAAARQISKVVARLDAQESSAPESWAESERRTPDYQRALERGAVDGLFRAAVQELALNHINTVAPPKRRHDPYISMERVDMLDLLEQHLGMVLSAGTDRPTRQALRDVIAELILDCALPRWLDIPLDQRN